MIDAAAVTMVYNEVDALPVWLRHYSAQVGARNCFVVDHGSDDGSTGGLGAVNVIRLPRSHMNEDWRAEVVSDICGQFLDRYRTVMHTDVDELLVADPAYHTGLVDFCSTMPLPVVTAVGFDVHHCPEDEPDIDPSRPVSAQRSWVRFVSAYCKAAAIRQPVRWAPGFHCCDARIVFGRLFLFHLKPHDVKIGLRRLQKSRGQAASDPYVPWYQAITDRKFERNLIWHARTMPRVEGVSLELADAPLQPWLQGIETEQEARAGNPCKLALDKLEPSLWRLPPRFVGTF